MTEKTTERRAYFRIQDTIGLKYTVLEGAGAQMQTCDARMEVSLGAMLNELDGEFNRAANTLWSENPVAAQALGLLNRKLTLLASHLLQEPPTEAGGHELIRTSISGCGMAFHSAEPLRVDTRLQVSAILRPSNIEVAFTASVVACERVSEIPSRDYLLRLAIDESCHAAREQLVQHTVQRQSAMLGAARNVAGADQA